MLLGFVRPRIQLSLVEPPQTSTADLEVQGAPTRLDGRNTAGLRLDLAGTGDFILREINNRPDSDGKMYQNISSGLIGIGTSTPNGYGNVKLDVAGAYGINNQGIINLNTSGDLAFGDLASGDGNINNIYFRTRDATKMTLTSNGRLGIGTLLRRARWTSTEASVSQVIVVHLGQKGGIFLESKRHQHSREWK